MTHQPQIEQKLPAPFTRTNKAGDLETWTPVESIRLVDGSEAIVCNPGGELFPREACIDDTRATPPAAPADVTRYLLWVDANGEIHEKEETGGEWVKFTDYNALKSERDAARAELATANAKLAMCDYAHVEKLTDLCNERQERLAAVKAGAVTDHERNERAALAIYRVMIDGMPEGAVEALERSHMDKARKMARAVLQSVVCQTKP